ncbi:hypothetical protein PT285_02250 [Lactobacillus sp. ESL0791]|nr:hypothetical protein [Lactobacillus sp. ESL0791]MDF7638255.1 hypothetical protein [Lactobacillus sp. ESL0791]
MNDALPDLAFEEAWGYLLTALQAVKEEITKEIELLPNFIQKQLERSE